MSFKRRRQNRTPSPAHTTAETEAVGCVPSEDFLTDCWTNEARADTESARAARVTDTGSDRLFTSLSFSRVRRNFSIIFRCFCASSNRTRCHMSSSCFSCFIWRALAAIASLASSCFSNRWGIALRDLSEWVSEWVGERVSEWVSQPEEP